MALPSSGQISFNDVRTETSQSQHTDFSMRGWVTGLTDAGVFKTESYSPINILSSGSRWEDTTNSTTPKKMQNASNYSMSAWYDYDHWLNINTNTTGTLYPHANIYADTEDAGPYSRYVRTMIPINIGTTDTQLVINYSGSLIDNQYNSYYIDVWYGKPWEENGLEIYSGEMAYAQNSIYLHHVTWSFIQQFSYTSSINFSYNWDYHYTASVGQYLYIVLSSAKTYTGGF